MICKIKYMYFNFKNTNMMFSEMDKKFLIGKNMKNLSFLHVFFVHYNIPLLKFW